MLRKLGMISALCLVFTGASVASAQTEDEAPGLGSPSDDSGSDGSAGMAVPPDETLGDPDAEPAPEDEPTAAGEDPLDPRELPDTDYFFLGLMTRELVVPGFIQGLFVNGGFDAFNGGFGGSFNWRRNNFNVVANVWWNNAGGEGFFRGVNEGPEAMEYIDIDLWVLFIQAEFLWSFPITDWFAIELGFDLGIGFIGGTLVRTEAQQVGGEWQVCPGPGAGEPCEPSGSYNYEEPNWLGGGDVPFVIPWVALPHLAVRFKPIRQVQIRIDGGYGLYNFFFGGSAYFGF